MSFKKLKILSVPYKMIERCELCQVHSVLLPKKLTLHNITKGKENVKKIVQKKGEN